MRRPVQVTLILALAACTPSTGLAAQERSIAMERFHADIEVTAAGDLVVTETLEPRFTGSWNGFIRSLALRPPADYGARYLLGVTVESVTDDQGTPLRHEISRPGRALMEIRIWVPDAADRVATVHLTYRVRNALGFFEAHPDGEWDAMDELDWNVTGTDWEMTIGSVSARITLPPGANPTQAAAYFGARDASGQVPVSLLDNGAAVEVTGPVPPGHGLTLAVGWPAGFVDRAAAVPGPVDADRHPPGSLAFLLLLVPAALFGAAWRTWDRTGRDPAERAITVQWEPPADLSPVEAGTLVDHRAEMHDLLATVVDLAVRGYLVIEEREKSGFLRSGKDYRFHLMTPENQWEGLAPHEHLFLRGLFKHAGKPDVATALGGRSGILRLVGSLAGDPADSGAPDGAVGSVRLTDLQNKFYKEIPAIRDAVYAELIRKGHYLERPDKVWGRWAAYGGLGMVGGAGVVIAAVALWGDHTTTIAVGAAALASILVLGIFGWIMPARTVKGARTREAALGFKRFLERVETPIYKRMITSPDQFERFLPFAMAFRCEEKWARAFDDLLQEPPDWYRGSHGITGFRASRFAADLGSLSTAAGAALSTSPSSSSSGGGGRVGGGGGGGGGRGF